MQGQAANWQPLEAPSGLRGDVVRRSEAEIAEVMDWAADTVTKAVSKEDAEYARGASDAIAWLLGQSEDNPREQI